MDAAYEGSFQFNAIDTRSALKVDFWLLRGHLFDREMFRRRLKTTLFGETAWVCTPEDAFRCFMGTGMEALAIGNCFLEKEAQDSALAVDYSSQLEPD